MDVATLSLILGIAGACASRVSRRLDWAQLPIAFSVLSIALGAPGMARMTWRETAVTAIVPALAGARTDRIGVFPRRVNLSGVLQVLVVMAAFAALASVTKDARVDQASDLRLFGLTLLSACVGGVATLPIWLRQQTVRSRAARRRALVGGMFVSATSAAFMVIAYGELGLPAFMVFGAGIMLVYAALLRIRAAHEMTEGTVRALSELVEHAGYVAEGHHRGLVSRARAEAERRHLRHDEWERVRLAALVYDAGLLGAGDIDSARAMSHGQISAGTLRVLTEAGFDEEVCRVCADVWSGAASVVVEADVIRSALRHVG